MPAKGFNEGTSVRNDSVRQTLRRALVGGGKFTWVHEPGSPLAVTCWPYSQVLHAFALSDSVQGPSRFPGLARGLNAYRDPSGNFRESIGRGKRYFDDNAWLGLSFLQRHKLSASRMSLHRAKDLREFVVGGRDARSGGILWVEEGDTINACSTGSTALLHAELGGETAGMLGFLYDLRNGDGLVRDHLRRDGVIEPSVYSYNQGLLISAALSAGRHEVAQEAADAGEAYFTAERLWTQAVSFNAIYCKALLRMGRPASVREYAERLWDEGRDDEGWFTRAGRYDEGAVLDTAGAMQIFTLLEFPQLLDKVV